MIIFGSLLVLILGILTGWVIRRDTLERKRAKEALRENETAFQTLAESLPQMVWMCTPDGMNIYFNQRWVNYTGLTLQESYGRGWNTPFHPDDKQPAWNAWNHAVETGDPYSIECRLRGADGVYHWFLTRGVPLRDATGAIVKWFGTCTDIDELKRTEEALAKSQALMKAIVESTADMIWSVDPENFKLLTFNRSLEDYFLRWCGIRLQIGTGPEEHFPTEDLINRWRGLYQRALAEGSYTTEYNVTAGSSVLQLTFNLLKSDGKVFAISVFGKNITESKQAEARLKESEQRYRDLIEHSTEGVWRLELEQPIPIDLPEDEILARAMQYAYIAECNLAFARSMGFHTPQEVVGKRLNELFLPSDQERLESFRSAARGGLKGRTVEFRGRDKAGNLRHLSRTEIPIIQNGRLVRMWGITRDTTELRQAENALREGEVRFRSLIENATVGIYRTTPEGHILMVNPTLVHMLGYETTDELKARNLEEQGFEPNYSRRAFREQIERDGEVKGLEFAWTKRDGSVIFVRESGRAIRGESGQVLWYDGIVEDITEAKRTEKALRESEERFRLFMNNSPTVAWMKDEQGRYVYMNETYARSLGVRLGDQQGKTDFELYPRAIAEQFRINDQAALAGDHPIEVIEESLTLDGKACYWLAYKFPFRDASGQAFVAGIGIDITESKRAEAEHVRLVTAIEQSAEAVVITNPAGNIEYVNPAFTRITGYGREEVLGRNLRILKSEKQDPAFYHQLWATISKGQTWNGELINRRKDGSLYTEQMNIAAVRGAHGEITHFIATKQDVTERKNLEDQVRQATKMEAVGRLAGGVAHDFNNLLTIINGYSELLLDKVAPDNEAGVYLKEVKDAGERAASLTRQLLAFSRRQVLDPQVLDLNSVVSDMEKMLKRLIGEDIALHTLLDPSLGRVKADPGQIEQVIMNLAVNARDAMPRGGDLTIETGNVELDEAYARSHVTVKPGPHVMLAISDNGLGMTPETQARIFEPFFTTKGKGQGTGLGLATVYGIVKQSGGSIWVYSELSQGTVFKVYFPAVGENLVEKGHSLGKADSTRGSETVLVVEDEEGVRSMVCSALESAGYVVLETKDGEGALTTCANHEGPIHLLLTDVVMPQMSGPLVAEKVAELRPGIKVLYMSGYTDDAVVHHGGLGSDKPFIQKPFSPATLRHKIREVLGRK